MNINHKVRISAVLIGVLSLGLLGSSMHAVYSVWKNRATQASLSQKRMKWSKIQSAAWQMYATFPPGEEQLLQWDRLLLTVENSDWYTEDMAVMVQELNNAVVSSKADLETAVTQAFAIVPTDTQVSTVVYNTHMFIFVMGAVFVVWLLQFYWMSRVGSRIAHFSIEQSQDRGNDELTLVSRQLNHCTHIMRNQIQTAENLIRQLSDIPESEEFSANVYGCEMVENNTVGLSEELGATTTAVANSIQHISGIIAELHGTMQQQRREVEVSKHDHSQMFAEIQRATHECISIDQKLQEVDRLLQNGNDAVVYAVEEMRSVERDIRGILDVIPIINTIAERTALLSMNASIESAHAGADGAGFAVVAEEIGKLAAEASQNADSIAESLHLTVNRVQQAREASEYSTEIFDAMRAAVYDYSQTITEINTSFGELSTGMREIQHAIQEILEATAIVDKLTSTMQVTSDALAQHLQRSSMETFHTMVGGVFENSALCAEQHKQLIEAIAVSQKVRSRIVNEQQKNTNRNG